MSTPTPVPEAYRDTVDALPLPLRRLLLAELAAGNRIAEVGHSHPAPPVGAYVKLECAVTTRTRADGDGLTFIARNNSLYSGQFSDGGGRYFILEPPLPPPPEPDMNAIRAAASVPWQSPAREPECSALERFRQSMVMNYERWHDGIGYDLDALASALADEREAIEALLVHRANADWRDVEALAVLGTPRAQSALLRAFRDGDAAVRAAVLHHAPELIDQDARAQSLAQALRTAEFYAGLSQTLDQVAGFHPPVVIDALLWGAKHREGEVAVHFAAMLAYVHGKAAEPFDMALRPLFLRFNTADGLARRQAMGQLCALIGVDPDDRQPLGTA